MGILRNLVKSSPVVGQAVTFYDIGKNVTKLTEPDRAVIESLKIIGEECIPVPFKLSWECAMLLAEIGASIALISDPVTGTFSVSIAIASATRVIARRL